MPPTNRSARPVAGHVAGVTRDFPVAAGSSRVPWFAVLFDAEAAIRGVVRAPIVALG